MNATRLFAHWPALARRHGGPAHPLVTAAICAVFVAPIAVSVYFIRDPASIFWSKSFSGGDGLSGAVKAVPVTGAARLGPGDPVVRFTDTRIGQVLYTRFSSDNCGRALFDNRTGATYDAPEVFCGQTPEQVIETDAPERLKALRKSFQR